MSTERSIVSIAVSSAGIVALPKRITLWFIGEIRYLFRVLIAALDRFYWDNGFSRAASLAYSTLLSLVPLTTLCFGLLASFAGSETADSKLKASDIRLFVFRQFMPTERSLAEVLRFLDQFNADLMSLNIVVVPFIVITSVLLLSSIEYALNQVWQVYEARPLSHRIAIYCALIVIAPILAISAFYTASIRVQPFIQEIAGNFSVANTVYTHLVPFVIDFFAFSSLYYLVPKSPVQIRAAVTGGFFSAILFDCAKGGFAYYIANFTSYERVYGNLSAIPIFLFWLYLAWAIVLAGAEVAFQAQYLPRTGKVWKRTLLSVGDAKLVLAVQALVLIAESFLKGERLPNELEVAETLGCSSVVLRPTLEALKSADIISRGDSREMPLVLKRAPDKISLDEIQLAIFHGWREVHLPREMEALFRACAPEVDAKKVSLSNLMQKSQ